jgi:hypothetical protein
VVWDWLEECITRKEQQEEVDTLKKGGGKHLCKKCYIEFFSLRRRETVIDLGRTWP